MPLCLPEVEIHFNIQRHINRYAIPHAWLEPPLLQCLDRVFIQTKPEAADDAQDIYCAVSFDDCFKNDRALISCFPRFFRVLRLHACTNSRRCNTTSDAEWAAAGTAALTGTDARSLAFANTTTLTVPDAAAYARAWRRWSRNSIRVTKVQQIDLWKRCQLGSNNCGFNNQ